MSYAFLLRDLRLENEDEWIKTMWSSRNQNLLRTYLDFMLTQPYSSLFHTVNIRSQMSPGLMLIEDRRTETQQGRQLTGATKLRNVDPVHSQHFTIDFTRTKILVVPVSVLSEATISWYFRSRQTQSPFISTSFLVYIAGPHVLSSMRYI